ncbi:transposase IS3/IS911 family protein [Acidimicrobium ferrooxidans DSM 10331]|uniref:Transposase IS3/IS911 family protein n=1 Tax=Acidimicrobium ferrooxidans (strain DSM 10331 / JCM 15462 / NBRC 103882 / ICP) TaxID=525909 RepID=C7LYW1_ACIFD|nr:transposase [Acidimicrobium ferrooxidans]ACU53122.1 transposase IS3/IS911 family protein [Acidimicrobium ferrooxidans DSM 10331]ACU53271.1 transposase IS3/IS911 family protein [Acidimicrobium ferrooxidans DSM 10331]ACU53481.1 transposase IS3/IS911 family protein [Acidimicrobium ferrooxidans DSM 10331]ACU53919.1 transposase IS3/IS911 family protein [Acidimicrobium ferrooxidans DSM 10331]ACU53920.1 transposase IS3/IS911 family protein [Acidimicrobium ferrooxidans DSM 10331]
MSQTPNPPPGDGPAGRRRGRYPSQFRKDAAALVLDQRRTIADVARELGINEQTLGNWVRQERIDRGEREGLTSAEREELTRLRRQVKQLTVERELLKRAMAFWVKEGGQ